MRALVLDGDQLSTLAVVRSLGRHGWVVEVGSHSGSPIAARSRYCRASWHYPDPMQQVAEFQTALTRRIRGGRYDVLFPVTERSLVPLRQIRAQIEGATRVAMAGDRALDLVLSKSQTMQLAGELDIPVPATAIIENADDLENAARIGFPLVLKTDTSKVWDAHGAGESFSAGYAADRKQLESRWAEQKRAGRCIAQQRVEGVGVGLGVLARNGALLRAFQYRRLHEVPIAGGGSSYRISEPLDPVLVDYAERILGSIGWDGVAMLEFKRSQESGKYWLLEINGRFWGALPLALAAGMDFPAWFAELLVKDVVAAGQNNYRAGVRCRSLNGEYAWLKEAIRRRPKPFTRYPSYNSIIRDTVRMLNPREHWDAQQVTDPVPGMVELRDLVADTFASLKNAVVRRCALKRARRVRAAPQSAAGRIARARNVLILCHGNIMRSPYAGARLRSLLQNKGNSTSVETAGLAAVCNRPADPRVISAARQRGLELEGHRARPVTAQMVSAADVILVMDVGQMVEVASKYPKSKRKTLLLSSLLPDIDLEIGDPVSRDTDFLEKCLNQIDRGLLPVADTLLGSRTGSANQSGTINHTDSVREVDGMQGTVKRGAGGWH